MDWHILALAAAEALSRVNLYFLTPCLLFVKIASEISWEQFVAYWPIPVFFSIFSITSWLVARIGSLILGFTPQERNFVTASIMFANTNTLPMALMQSLAFSDAGKSLLRDDLDTPEQVAARGFSYILFYAIFGNFVRWSYGFNLLVPQDPAISPVASPTSVVVVDSQENDQFQKPMSSKDCLLSRFCQPRVRRLARRTLRTTRQLMTPPLVTALISLVVGLVPFLHKTMMTKSSKFFTFLVRPLDDCGAAAIPMIVLCLGAQVVDFCKKGQQTKELPPLSSFSIPPDQDDDDKEARRPEDEFTSERRRKVDDDTERHGGAFVDMPGDFESEKGAGVGNDDTVRSRQSLGLPPTLSRVSTRSTLLESNSSTRAFTNPSGSRTNLPMALTASRPPDHTSEKVYEVDSRRPSQVTLAASDTCSPSSSASSTHGGKNTNERPVTPCSQKSQVVPLEYQQQARHKIMGPIPYVLLIRLLILPSLCLPMVMYHPRSLFPHLLATDPTFSLALVLLASSPTAINIIQMCQIKGFFEKEMAGVLFWSYCILGVPSVLGWSMISLWVAAR
ncbi:hypothetical protein BGW41_001800 [Actinomortierella wolfii]|nr:hypothetical protein BGW41_001800 [Actinomortierella wolfii]